MRYILLTRKQKKSISLANDNNALKAKFISNISAQLNPTLHKLDETIPEVKALLLFSQHISTLSDLENSMDEEVELEEVQLASFCEDLMGEIRGKVKDSVTLKVNVPNMGAKLNKAYVSHILLHLLNNAVKYTKEGRVTLRVAGLAEEGEVDLVFSIQDSGVGIKEENIPRLFEAFYRIDEASYKNEEGTGLGLPIVSKLLARMDGEIEIDSEPGEGSSFTVHLKQKILGDTTLENTLKQGRDAGNMEREEERIFASDAKILVVDDNQINLFVTESLLSTTKAKITTKSGGKEALEILLKEKFDLVFMDHMMPEMNGVDVLHYLQKTQGHPNQNTPIVVLTANAISGTREKYLLEGFTDYISKPVDGAQLLGIMKKYLPAELVKYEEDEK